MYALIQGGVIHDLSPNDAAWPRDLFDVRDVSAIFGVAIGGRIDEEGTYTPPNPPDIDLPAYCAARRFAMETRGIEVAGALISTSRDSQALIIGALLRTMRGADTIRWKSETGFVDLSAEQVGAMADAVGTHVQDAFDREATALAGIEDGSIVDRAGIDALFD